MTRTTTRWFAAAAASVAAFALMTAPIASATIPVEAAKTTATKTATSAAAQAAVAADYVSIFADQAPTLSGAGWATCPSPITWSVDTSALPADEVDAQVANLQAAFDVWSQASGLVFQYAGTTSLTYDDGAFNVTAADGSAQPERSIYLDFVRDSASARLGNGVVGLASPSAVWQSSMEIVNGEAVFLSDYVSQASDSEATALYVHELGHILGLGHAAESQNRMYGIVKDQSALGAGDINGVQSMLKPCTTGA
ncbi:MAG: matrixin family metalloprotease [Actinomycetales bacterium]|nr:matrixin family metalloprotease [Actinomycetales bacterium]